MLFSSTIFLFVFLPIAILGYYILKPSRKLQNLFLFASSILFYAFGEQKFVFIMLLSILMNYIMGMCIYIFQSRKKIKKCILIVCILFNLCLIFVYKYLGFTTRILHSISPSIRQISILLPIGISFFTFQALSYVVDVYRKPEIVQKNPLHLGLYIALFPQLIAGPIVRYETIADQILNRKESIQDFSQGCVRFITGLAKKVILANNFALIAEKAFHLQSDQLSITFAWLGAIAYTMQIFFDFSGYSDMAIGLGNMFGFHFEENFNYPYISKSITEFWRRWHISLGSWFRDYVYIPLGGSKVSNQWKLIRNLGVVWILTGIWHGANTTFILWGIMYFILLTFEKIILKKKTTIPVVSNLITMLFVIIGWVIFNSNSIGDAFCYLGAMFGRNGLRVDSYFITSFLNYYMYIIIGILFCTPLISKLMIFLKDNDTIILKILYPCFYIIIFLISVSSIVKGAYNPFIYFNF